jgi:hypothetical protein
MNGPLSHQVVLALSLVSVAAFGYVRTTTRSISPHSNDLRTSSQPGPAPGLPRREIGRSDFWPNIEERYSRDRKARQRLTVMAVRPLN